MNKMLGKIGTIIFFLLLSFQVQNCQNPQQTEGSCTRCLPTENLQNGFCYRKIRGCLTQRTLECTKCQEGYVLSEKTCMIEAEYISLRTLRPSSKKIQEPKIGSSQITLTLVGEFKEMTSFTNVAFIQAKATFFKQYPELNGLKLFKVEQQQSYDGINYIFYLINDENQDLYVARVHVSSKLQGTVDQVYKNNISIRKTNDTVAKSSKKPRSSSLNVTRPITTITGFSGYSTNLNSPFYIQAKKTLFNQYPVLQRLKVIKVQSQVTTGMNYSIYMIDQQKNDSYFAQVDVNQLMEATVDNIYRNNASIKQGTQVFQLIQEPQQGDWSEFADVNRSYFIKTKELVHKTYPKLEQFKYKLVRVEYQVVAGINLLFFYSLNNNNFTVLTYKSFVGEANITSTWGQILNTSNQDPQNVPHTSPIPITNHTSLQIPIGGYSPTRDFTSASYLQAKLKLMAEYPFLKQLTISKVEEQVFNGINYLFFILDEKTGDKYVAKVYVTDELQAEVGYINKNGISITKNIIETNEKDYTNGNLNNNQPSNKTLSNNSQPSKQNNSTYSWRNDPIFTELYKFFKKEVNQTNFLPVKQVTRQLISNNTLQFWKYTITYSEEDYVTCSFYPAYSIYEVSSYIIDGTQMYNPSIKKYSFDRSENSLIGIIEEFIAKKFARILVKEITHVQLSDSYSVFTVNAYNFNGHWEILLLDKGQLIVIRVNRLDMTTCFSINHGKQTQYFQEYIIEQIRTFLFTKYSLSGFELTIASVNAFNSTTSQYALLLVREDFKKIKVVVQQTNDDFVMKKVDILNDRMYVVTDSDDGNTAENVARNQFAVDLNGFERGVVMSNGTATIINFGSQSTLSTYTKLSQSTKGELKKQPFINPNPCAIINASSVKFCQKCNDSDFLWSGKCFTIVPNCAIQVGSECVVCDKFSIKLNGKCTKDCVDVFAI